MNTTQNIVALSLWTLFLFGAWLNMRAELRKAREAGYTDGYAAGRHDQQQQLERKSAR